MKWVTVSLPNASADYYIAFNGTVKYGRGITLDNILNSLINLEHEVTIDSKIEARARLSVDRMLNGWKPLN